MGPRATVTRTVGAGVLEIDGRPAVEFYERFFGPGQPAIANPLAVFETATSDRFYLRAPVAYDHVRGSIAFFGAIPDGATIQLTMAGIDQIVDGARASIVDALAGFRTASGQTAPSSSRARRASSCWGRGPAARSSWCGRSSGDRPDRRLLLHGRDRPDGVDRSDPIPQRHDGLGPPRVRPGGWDRTQLTTEPAGPRSPDELEKENLRLTRRLQRLEDNVQRLERFQDSNATLQSRLLVELEAERANSQRLLRNVLPQRIIDRLAAGETLIADRHEMVSVLFSDIVGFTETSARLAPAA